MVTKVLIERRYVPLQAHRAKSTAIVRRGAVLSAQPRRPYDRKKGNARFLSTFALYVRPKLEMYTSILGLRRPCAVHQLLELPFKNRIVGLMQYSLAGMPLCRQCQSIFFNGHEELDGTDDTPPQLTMINCSLCNYIKSEYPGYEPARSQILLHQSLGIQDQLASLVCYGGIARLPLLQVFPPGPLERAARTYRAFTDDGIFPCLSFNIRTKITP
jgi:hypothetical protein